MKLKKIKRKIRFYFKERRSEKEYAYLPKWSGADIRPHSVLICEPHTSHGECLAGWSKYWQDLGYHVDIITRYENYVENPLCRCSDDVRIFGGSLRLLQTWLKSKQIQNYEHLFISSSVIFDYGEEYFLDVLGFMPKGNGKTLFIDHMPHLFLEKYDEKKLVAQNQIFTLSNVSDMPQLNPHYFGKIEITPKNEITTFVAIGRIASNARSYDSLLDSVRSLAKSGFHFVVCVIGSGNLDIPEDLKKYIVHLGRLDYPHMYEELEKADFIVAGLDPFNPKQRQYLLTCTTGNLQLSLGFKKPMILNELFGKHYELEDACLMYSDNELLPVMKEAIQMNQAQYAKLQKKLEKLADDTYKRSLTNLKQSISGEKIPVKICEEKM